jgi:hypothetical protein
MKSCSEIIIFDDGDMAEWSKFNFERKRLKNTFKGMGSEKVGNISNLLS